MDAESPRLGGDILLSYSQASQSSRRRSAGVSEDWPAVSGRFAGEGHRRGGTQTIGRNRVVAAMAVATAALALFLDVGQLTAGRHFAIAADNAAACEIGEAEEANETHSDELKSKRCT